jgi:hypothetical protein
MVLNKDWASRPSVTRDELAQHFKRAMPKVEERVLGTSPATAALEARKAALMQEQSAFRPYTPEHNRLADEIQDIREQIVDARNGVATKFQQYTLPGGENYREVLLKAPEEKITHVLYPVIRPDGMTYGHYADRATADSVAQKIGGTLGEPKREEGVTGFRSSHWPDPNVLAHLRLSDRTGPNGEKILHVEEIQSDWGQEGRKHGWKASPEERALHHAARAQIDAGNEDLKAVGERLVAAAGLPDRANHMMSIRNLPHDARHQAMEEHEARVHKVLQHPEYREALDRHTALLDKLRPSLIKDEGDIVHGPFVTSTPGWTDLALKRVLKEAADGGYHKVVWTPGAEQAKRWNLSHEIDRIAYNPSTKELRYVKSGDTHWSPHSTSVDPKELPNLIGKDAADSLLSEPLTKGVHDLETENLKIGDKGMKSYYDQMVPKRLQELIKKHDKNAKVGMTDIMLPPVSGKGHNNPPIQAPGFDVTPQMIKSIQRGQALFKDGGLVDAALNIARQHKVK